jgi:hypothetical protein
MSNEPSPKSKNSILQWGLIALFGVLAWLFVSEYFGVDGYRNANIPKDIQVNYKPVDFKPQIDESDALRILSNPQRYPDEFDKLVRDVNMQLLGHVVNRMGLVPEIEKQILSEYDRHHPYLKNLYYNDFVSLKDTTSYLYEAWYSNESANAVDILNEVASKYTCFFVNQILTSYLKTENGKLSVKGRQVATPCGVALTEALRPMVSRLRTRARVEDFSRSRGMMKEKITTTIAELATVEVRDKKGINKELMTKVWGIQVSKTNIEISALSIAKVGFKLDKNLSVELKGNRLIMILPPPQILSHEVFPRVDKLDQGWMRELQSDDFNKNINILRQYFRQDIADSDAFAQAQVKVTKLMQTLMTPVLQELKNVKLEVQFAQPTNTGHDEVPAQDGIKPIAD